MTSAEHRGETNNRKITLALRNVVKKFGDLTAVDRVSLEISEGEIFSLLGPSGCGKTTLLRLVAGFEDPDEGEILIDGAVVNNILPNKRDCNIVFQQHALFPHMTVFQNIGFGLVERRLPKKEIRDLVIEAVDFVNLRGMETRYPSQLSGGQQQRVALARSLVLKPKILLLDEPLAALDRKLRKEMQTELKRIQREVGITFLNVTHDQKEALSLSDRIAVMRDGEVVQIGTPKQIYGAPESHFVASFMGATNIFSGKIVTIFGDRVELATNDGMKINAPTGPHVKTNRVDGVSVHPELIEIVPGDPDEKIMDPDKYTFFKGTVKEVFFQGEFSELLVKLNDSPMILTIYLNRGIDHGDQVSEGKAVTVYWEWRKNNILMS